MSLDPPQHGSLGRIVVEVPSSDSSRHRVEPRMFERLDAIRAAERTGSIVIEQPRAARWPWLAAAGGLAVAALALVVVLKRPPSGETRTATPSHVVTPVGGASRFTIDDAVIEAGGDTSVEVQTGDGGAVTLVLARGSVDCEVAPRHGRPFRVIAGDVTVEVVGTRFAVTKSPEVRVDVTHGKVRVVQRDREWFVAAGERWPETTAAAPPPPTPNVPPPSADAPPAPEPAPEPEHVAKPKPIAHSGEQAFLSAQRLEPRDWAAAAKAYRGVARGDDRWAALALYSLAELETSHGHAAEALAAVEQYARRFPRGASAEDAAWLRVEALRSLGRADQARTAAGEYLARFPAGTYAKPAARLAAPP